MRSILKTYRKRAPFYNACLKLVQLALLRPILEERVSLANFSTGVFDSQSDEVPARHSFRVRQPTGTWLISFPDADFGGVRGRSSTGRPFTVIVPGVEASSAVSKR